MKKRFLITALVIGSALIFGACGSKKDNTETQTTVTEDTTTKEDTGSSQADSSGNVKVDMNFDLANHLDEGYDEVVKAYPEPASDELNSETGERVLKYTDPERIFHLYDDKSGGYVLEAISAKAGDLFSFTADKIKLSDMLDKMEGQQLTGLDSNNVYLTVGENGGKNIVFQSEGYYFIVAVDNDDTISKNASAAIVTEDRASFDKTGVTTAAPADIQTIAPETKEK